jgi:aldehyde dehydrogenase (NAD+)
VNNFQPIFDKQKDYFNIDATKSYEWRIEQLDRMAKMLNENNEAFQEAVSQDFKTALEEKVFEVAAPLATIEFTKMQLKEWMKADLRHGSKGPRGLGTHGPSYPGAIRRDADHWSV